MPAIPTTHSSHNNSPLDNVLHLLRLTGSFYCQSELGSPWGVDLPEFCGQMMFHIVTEGQCWLEVKGEQPILLHKGCVALVTRGSGHTIRNDMTSETLCLWDIETEKVNDHYERIHFEGGGDKTYLTCGCIRFDHIAAQQLIEALPRVVYIDTSNNTGSEDWLNSMLQLITQESRNTLPGSERVMTHLADIIIIQAIRSWIMTSENNSHGWLNALKDKRIGKAIASFHQAPERSWSVAMLANEAGMSRSSFSAQFSHLVGCSVIKYVTSLRMGIARTQLMTGSQTLTAIANNLGYASEASFCRAFKKIYGVSPGKFRSSERQQT